MENNEQSKIKVLAWGDYCCTTGFGTVMSNIMRQLDASGRYEIDVIGVNFDGSPHDKAVWPGNVWPATIGMMGGNYADLYGRQKLIDFIGTGKYDVVFMLNDTFIVQEMMGPLRETLKAMGQAAPKIVYYYPLDAPPQKKWIEDVVSQMDYPVTYTNWARDLALAVDPSLDKRLRVIYHGTNTEEFQPVPQETIDDFRNKWFTGKAEGKFIITNINRNQPRKDTVRNLLLLRELKERGHDNVLMYLHMQVSDAGGNILLMAEQLGLELEKDFMLPHPNIFNANKGVPVDIVNLIYNASDLIFTPTLGEGWGLSLTEAFATKTPVVGPRNTSVQEILADNRGVLIDCGSDPSCYFVQKDDLDRIRPIIDVDQAADEIEGIMDGTTKVDVEAAYQWAKQHTWDNVCRDWVALIDEAAAAKQQQQSILAAPNRATRRKAKKLKQVG